MFWSAVFFSCVVLLLFFFSSRRRHTRCALATGVQTCALPICGMPLYAGPNSMSYSMPEAARACAYAAPNVRIAIPEEILPRLKKYGDLRPDLRDRKSVV